jgi:hypothetical protein
VLLAVKSPKALSFKYKLLLNRSANRAGVCASAAADAFISVDFILAISFGNARNRASLCASAAADALVGNLVCHRCLPPKIFTEFILTYLQKKSRGFIKKYIYF